MTIDTRTYQQKLDQELAEQAHALLKKMSSLDPAIAVAKAERQARQDQADRDRAELEAKSPPREVVFQLPVQVVTPYMLKRVANVAGGYSLSTVGEGGWINGDGDLVVDKIQTLTVAVEDQLMAYRVMENVILFAYAAEQEALYVRWPDGEVEFIDVDKEFDSIVGK